MKMKMRFKRKDCKGICQERNESPFQLRGEVYTQKAAPFGAAYGFGWLWT
jgi:hypothetical protein